MSADRPTDETPSSRAVEDDAHPSEARRPRSDEDEDDDDDKPSRILLADDALAKLREGVMLQNVKIIRPVFQGEFPKPVILRRVVLVQPEFRKAKFLDRVELKHCRLERPTSKRTEFVEGLSLSGSTLASAALRELTVKGPFEASGMRTKGKFLIGFSRFEDKVRFWDARFEGWCDFKECEFLKDADFRSLHAEEGFVLSKSTFRGDFLFRGSAVSKKLDLSGSRFEGLLDLSKAKLPDYAYLETIEQGDRQRFAFQNAVAERLLVRPEQLIGRLESEETGDHAGAMQEYALLKRAYSSLHRYDQEDWAFYRFKVNQRRSRPRSWSKPWTKLGEFADWLLLDRGCGYGADPLRAVRAALIIMFTFGVIFMIGADQLYIEKMPFEGHDIYYLPNRLLAGFMTSVSVFTSGFGSLRDTAKGWMNLPLVLESLLGTFLWGLFIVAFSRKVIR